MKGIFGTLIAAIVFFTAGGISAAILGTKEGAVPKSFKVLDRSLLSTSVTDGGSWEFDGHKSISVDSSSLKTRIEPTDGDKITVSISGARRRIYVAVSESKDGDELAVSMGYGFMFGFFFGDNAEAVIGLPRAEYDKLEASIGSGKMSIKDINAKENKLDVSSGKLEFSQNTDFNAELISLDMGSGSAVVNGDAKKLDIGISSGSAIVNGGAERLDIDIGSGSLTMDTAKTENFDIEMSSGKFEINGLSGSGAIDVSSGRGLAYFTDTSKINGSEFELSSGSLTVYLPPDTNAEINADVGSGSVTVDCCGVKEILRDDDRVVLGSGGARISADVSSGKMSFNDN